MTRLLFLPGAGASPEFWRPVAERLKLRREMHFLSWPGLGNEAPDPNVQGLDDLVDQVLAQMVEPVDLLAQSMGGLVALKAAIAAPERVRRLVLSGTSGGIPVDDVATLDWRPDYRREFPGAARWISEVKEDLSASLGKITAPALLLWGETDPISPVGVGERLASRLPNATLRIVPGGDHGFVQSHASMIVPWIVDHLR